MTSTQIRAASLKKQVERGEISVKGVLETRGETSAGSYYRVLTQAKLNVTKSIYTVLLASRLGILSLEDLQRLIVLVSRVPSEPSSTDLGDVIPLIEALIKRLVML